MKTAREQTKSCCRSGRLPDCPRERSPPPAPPRIGHPRRKLHAGQKEKNASRGRPSDPLQRAGAAGTALSAKASTALDLARLLVILAAPHLLLDPTPLHQFTEPPHRLLDRLALPQRQLDHSILLLLLLFAPAERAKKAWKEPNAFEQCYFTPPGGDLSTRPRCGNRQFPQRHCPSPPRPGRCPTKVYHTCIGGPTGCSTSFQSPGRRLEPCPARGLSLIGKHFPASTCDDETHFSV